MKSLYTANSESFKKAITIYSLLGGFNGLIRAYFVLFIILVLGTRNTLLALNLGAAAGIVMIPVYKRAIKHSATYNNAVLLSNTVLFIADLMVPIAYYYPNYAFIASFLNGFIAGGMSVMNATYVESYVMHLYGLENRARLTSLKTIITNGAAVIMLLASRLFYSNVLLIFTTVEILRFLMVGFVFLSPKVKIEVHGRPKSKHVFTKKLVLVFIGIFLLQAALRIYAPIESKIIKDTLGAAAVSYGNATTMLATIIVFYTLLRYTSEYGKIIWRTGWLILATTLFFTFSIENNYLFAAAGILSVPMVWLFIMSLRHYAIKKAPKEETTNIIYTVNFFNYLVRFFIAVITYFIIAGAPLYFLIASLFLAISAVFAAASKL